MISPTHRLVLKSRNAKPLSIGSLAHGGGVLAHAIHTGLKEAGIPSELSFANDIRSDLLNHAARVNDTWSEKTILLPMPIQRIAFNQDILNRLPEVDILEAGLPCSGASAAGRASRHLPVPEAHPEVGHLIVPFLVIVAKVKPAIIVFENVKLYQSTASMYIMRNHLRDFGYEIHEEILRAAEWNSLEHRERLCVVAVASGLQFDFSWLERPQKVERKIAEILDPIPHDSPSWREMAGLKAKQKRDLAEGKGFALQIVTAESSKCPTITKGYAKVRSTDPKLQHPNNPNLLRQFTAAEHARMKGVPEHLIEGLSQTVAHELLGQSICYEPFKAVAKSLGVTIKMASKGTFTPFEGESNDRV